MNIYTAQYRYNGPTRLDITIRANQPPGKVLAPTWDMVKAYKNGQIDAWQYTMKYWALLMNRMLSIGDSWRLMWDEITETSKPELVLVCFCPPGEFCHRFLAASLMAEMGVGVYHGEINPETY